MKKELDKHNVRQFLFMKEFANYFFEALGIDKSIYIYIYIYTHTQIKTSGGKQKDRQVEANKKTDKWRQTKR